MNTATFYHQCGLPGSNPRRRSRKERRRHYVSATEPADRDDSSMPPGKPAMVIVNAVVKAYMDNIVNCEREKKGRHLSELEDLHVKKDQDVRNKRELLKREQENMNATDERAMMTQVQL